MKKSQKECWGDAIRVSFNHLSLFPSLYLPFRLSPSPFLFSLSPLSLSVSNLRAFTLNTTHGSDGEGLLNALNDSREQVRNKQTADEFSDLSFYLSVPVLLMP